jgi:phenylpropionate dioxygenase-like ring-hydroxylating dioxygenase large terminal subunit
MNYLRNAWYVAAWGQDLETAKPAAITILNEPIVLYRTEANRLVALADRCVHRLAPLSLGRCEGERLRCMYHGLLFDADGRVVEIPGQDLVPAEARVRVYPVTAKHEYVWIWMGDPALADETMIPPAQGFGEPGHTFGHGFLDIEAEARLCNDNLLDLSHLGFVHTGSLGALPARADQRTKLAPFDRGVRLQRWTVGTPIPARGTSQLVDGWLAYEFFVPGVLLMWRGFFPSGTAARSGFGRPDYSQALPGLTFTKQAITPLGKKRARYSFGWERPRKVGDEAALTRLAAQAFAEDQAMIEAQQQVVDDTPEPRFMPTEQDKAVVLYNRLLKKLLSAEAAAHLQRPAHEPA